MNFFQYDYPVNAWLRLSLHSASKCSLQKPFAALHAPAREFQSLDRSFRRESSRVQIEAIGMEIAPINVGPTARWDSDCGLARNVGLKTTSLQQTEESELMVHDLEI